MNNKMNKLQFLYKTFFSLFLSEKAVIYTILYYCLTLIFCSKLIIQQNRRENKALWQEENHMWHEYKANISYVAKPANKKRVTNSN